MKILMDARCTRSRSTGVGNYANSIIHYLSKIDTINHYKIIFPSNQKNVHLHKEVSNLETLYIKNLIDKRILRDLWYQSYVPSIIRHEKIAIYHGLDYILPIYRKPRDTLYVTTVHGLALFLHKNVYSGIKYNWARYLINKSLNVADMIIAVSNCVKNELTSFFHINSTKIKVIHLGISERFKATLNALDVIKMREKYKLKDRDYILFIANDPIKKNAVRLMKSYLLLRKEYRNKNLTLVIAGAKAYQCKSFFATISGGYGRAVKAPIMFIAPSYEDIPLLYKGAILYVHPSLYEACPAPPLEAMACGIPVVASNTSSIPEVVGDAALLFDPYNVEEMAAVIYKVLTDEQLRDKLRQRGFERVKQFSWEKAARETLAVYNELYNSRR